MDITPLVPQGKLIITRYGNGAFTVDANVYAGPIFITQETVLPWQMREGALLEWASLAEAMFAPFFAQPPELLLIGSGRRGERLSIMLQQQLKARGITAEAMDTGAACRTYNVLLGEDRAVAAALFAV